MEMPQPALWASTRTASDAPNKNTNNASKPRALELKQCKTAAAIMLAKKVWEICGDISIAEMVRIPAFENIRNKTMRGTKNSSEDTAKKWIKHSYKETFNTIQKTPSKAQLKKAHTQLKKLNTNSEYNIFVQQIIHSLDLFITEMDSDYNKRKQKYTKYTTSESRKSIFNSNPKLFNLLEYFEKLPSKPDGK